VNITVRVDKELKDKLQKIADDEDRSLSNWIRQLIKKELEK